MSSEYVRFLADESQAIQKDALTAELETLTSLKHLHEYKKFRHEGFKLKISLKSRLDELGENLQVLDKVLPISEAKIKHEEKEIVMHKEEKSTIEEELAEIQRKLAALR
ncbi:hypothetical protein HYZ97_00240 [Candidatus Pacearchaeota archaeon]|nr:hypothetical protein [Candidatus Pacearchaeota archaeon]